ncbi:META domain-containing protein [Pseudochelatococcus sp. B33]
MLTSISRIASVVALAAAPEFAHLARAQEPPDTPHGAWVVVKIGGEDPTNGSLIILELHADGSVSGSGGCNRFRSTFEFARDTIRFDRVAGTMMACSPALMAQEQRFYKALEDARAWRRTDGKLELFDSSGTALARFTAQSRSATITIEVPHALKVDRSRLTYDCAGTPVEVEYFNAGGTSLATLSLRGEFVVAANVIAASGARYAGERLIWWTKGDKADLYDLTKSEDTPVSCEVTGGAKPVRQ